MQWPTYVSKCCACLFEANASSLNALMNLSVFVDNHYGCWVWSRCYYWCWFKDNHRVRWLHHSVVWPVLRVWLPYRASIHITILKQSRRFAFLNWFMFTTAGILMWCKVQIVCNFSTFYVRKQLLLSARLSHRNSVCLSVCHTGGSVKNGAS